MPDNEVLIVFAENVFADPSKYNTKDKRGEKCSEKAGIERERRENMKLNKYPEK